MGIVEGIGVVEEEGAAERDGMDVELEVLSTSASMAAAACLAQGTTAGPATGHVLTVPSHTSPCTAFPAFAYTPGMETSSLADGTEEPEDAMFSWVHDGKNCGWPALCKLQLSRRENKEKKRLKSLTSLSPT